MKTKTAKKTPAPGLDWTLRPRTAAGMATQSVLGMTAVSAVGNVCEMHWALGVGAGLLGAAATFVTSQRVSMTGLYYRAACWLGAGGWTAWALEAGPFHREQLGVLALGGLAAGLGAPLGRAKNDEAQQPTAAAPGTDIVLRQGGEIGMRWASYIHRVTNMWVQVTSVQPWPQGGGFTLTALLPLDGTHTVATLKGAADRLATVARLPIGCGVEVALGEHRGEAVLRVSTVNRMGDMVSLPEDYSPLSINRPLPLGMYRDGSPVTVLLRELAMLVIGARGSGKTNLLDLLTLLLLRCSDTLVWHIDMNGGGMSQVWLHPWIEGDIDRPAIDWAAPNPEEAIQMVQIAMNIARARKRTGRKLKVQADSKLLPISPGLPEIVIMVDEGKSVLAPGTRGTAGQVGKKLEEILDQARNEGVNIIASGLRATSTTVSADFKVQCGLKICGRVQKESELQYLFGWDRIDLADIPSVGCFFIQADDEEAPRPFKAAFLPPSRMTAAAVMLAEGRPRLDEAAARIGGQVYAQRHERMRAAFLALDDDEDGDVLDVEEVQEAPRRLHSVPAELGTGSAGSWANPQELRQRARTAYTPTAAPERVFTAERVDRPEPAPIRPLPPLLTAAIRAFGTDTRMHSEDLAAHLSLDNKHRLAELLGALEVYPLGHAFERGGRQRRGYERKDLEAAARAITEGRQDVPDEVYAWAS
ncbi:hypothetical protein [Actinocorallia aurantiaca]|uniref:FtsK domain-containing protein n=1 Tax=Actinocorallia aurantiaca TaxID=46204 RepID=A0ABN3URZ8_9ACTN